MAPLPPLPPLIAPAALAALLMPPAPAPAAVRLPAILSDHMVLQRSAATPVWGWANAGEPVSVRFGTAAASTHAGSDGRWRVTLDLADIHPRDKRTVGLRLANLALAGTYGRRDIAAHGPRLKAMQVENGRALLAFDHGDGLFASDRKPLSWFQVAGADGRWHPAGAAIVGGRVAVASPKVPQPVHVRFAWDEAAQPNLVNAAGLPAVPFNTAPGMDAPPPAAGSADTLELR